MSSLLDRGAELADLRAHRLHLLAARRWRARGITVPEELHADEQRATIFSLAAPLALEQVRALCEGPIVLLKGPELGAYYPDPALRPATDVDLLVPDPEEVQRRLLRGGFVAIGEDDPYYAGAHHLRPLYSPTLGIKLEVHRRPEWVDWSPAPPAEELFDVAVPAAVGIDGISSLPRGHHALVVAAHSWSTVPLRRILDLVDLEALVVDIDRRTVGTLADRWDLGGVWRTMVAAGDSLLLGAPPTWPLRTWASDMRDVREATVLRTHIRRLAGPSWALPPRRAANETLAVIARELAPAPGETWRRKLGRMGSAFRDAFRPRSEHDRRISRRI